MSHSPCTVYVSAVRGWKCSDAPGGLCWRQSSRWHRPVPPLCAHKQQPALDLDVTAGLRPKPDSLGTFPALRHTLFSGAGQHNGHTLTAARGTDMQNREGRTASFILLLTCGISREATPVVQANTPPWIRANSSPVSLRRRHAALKPLQSLSSAQTYQYSQLRG